MVMDYLMIALISSNPTTPNMRDSEQIGLNGEHIKKKLKTTR